MRHIKTLNEAGELVTMPASSPGTDVSVPGETRVTREQEGMRGRLEQDVKRLYPGLEIRHTNDGQSGVSVNNVVIYASDHYEAFNAFLFGLVMAKAHGSDRGDDRMPARRY